MNKIVAPDHAGNIDKSEESDAAQLQYHWAPGATEISLIFRRAVCQCGASPYLYRRTKNLMGTIPDPYEYQVACVFEGGPGGKQHDQTDWFQTTKEAISTWVVTHYLEK